MPDNLLLAREGRTALITVNRPQVLNALNSQTLIELGQAITDVRSDASVRVVVITGTGEKAFVAGADIGELAALSPSDARTHARLGQGVFDAIEQLGKPSIAAINGFALGGGCELAMACTLRVAADTARLGQPEINLGILPGFAGTQRLTRLVGKGAALDLLLTGRHVTAEEAHRLGLVTRVVPAAELMATVSALAAELAAKAPIAMQYLLEAVQRGGEIPFDDAAVLEASLFGLAFSTADMHEGTRAFLDKRKPAFKGE
jgi:enoyl-CoA hydratase